MVKMNKRNVLKVKLLVFISLTVLLFAVLDVRTINADNKVKLYFFWGKGCPHCTHEKIFLEKLEKKYPLLEVKSYEVWYDQENAKLFSDMAEAYGTRPEGVPTTFIGDYRPLVGYRNYEVTGKLIEKKVKYCIENICTDPIQKIYKPSIKKEIAAQEKDEIVTLPVLGKIDASKMTLPVLTIVIAGLDGFNPCAFFVLFTLLSILVYAQSRKRMLLIGGTFVFFSGFVYFLFMSAWLNLFLYIGELKIITTVAGVIALVIASINIKDFFIFKKGVSLVIPEKVKPGLYERMRKSLKATSLTSMMIGTIVLSVAANAYELLCTIGFPMVYTRVLTLSNLPRVKYYIYLIFYNIIYVIPLAGIVLLFSITLGGKKLTEWQGQVLKLISGLMMLGLGLVLLINPALFNNVFVAVGLLLMTLASAGIIIFITKKVTCKTKKK
jgi:thiol-disulfide isomerase/thioredoxin